MSNLLLKLAISKRAPAQYDRSQFEQMLQLIEDAVNAQAEERIYGKYWATVAAPTTGSWMQGDFVRNTAVTELGSASSKYVIHGWVCTAAGTPGTWVECRYLTGN